MNNLNKIKFLVKNLFNKNSFDDKIYIYHYINNKKLRKNIYYSLAINKLMECKCHNFASLISEESLQNSSKFKLIIERLFNKYEKDKLFLGCLNNSNLSKKDRYDDIILKCLDYTNKDNLSYFIQLCERYYKFVYFEIDTKYNKLETTNYEYMVEKFLSLKDESIAKFYFNIFKDTKLLELNEYTTFVDKVFEIKNETKLELLANAIKKCVKNYNVEIYPILERVNKIDDDLILEKINLIFKLESLNKLDNSRLILLYMLHLKDYNLLDEYERILSSEVIGRSNYLNTIMNNAIIVRNPNTLFELRKVFNNTYSSKHLDIICKLNYTDEAIYDILRITNNIITLLNNDNISLLKTRLLETLFNQVLTNNNSKIILECLNLLEQEVISNIEKMLILNNTNNLANLVCSKIEQEEQNVKKIYMN